MTDKQMSFAHDTTPTIEEVLACWEGQSAKWKTRKEIADGLGRSKSPTLIAVLGIAAGSGILRRKTVRLPNGVDMFMYRPATPADYGNRQ